MKLSIAIVACNEAANLRRTLSSVVAIGERPDRLALEIVLVDSGSTDETVSIAQEFGATVFHEPWQGFAAQKNSAIDHCSGDWILSLDADEELSPSLRSAIVALFTGPRAFSAYRVRRLNHFLGRPLRHGGYYPDPKLRLFRKGAARFEDRPVHESLQTTEPVGLLDGDLLHHCYPTLDEYIEHMNRYSALGAAAMVAQGRARADLLWFMNGVLLNPLATFVYNYLARLGFLDGRAGLLQHLYHSAYISWKYAKAWKMLEKVP